MSILAFGRPISLAVGIRLAAVVLSALGGAGCTSAELYRAIYDALHSREELVNPAPASGPAPRRPDYPAYEAERQRLRDERASSGRAVLPSDRDR
jgi:hypothetical protein